MHLVKKRLSLAPTDLSNFLSCKHLTRLDLNAVQTGTARPQKFGPVIDELRRRGTEHELAYLEHLRSQGLHIVEVGRPDSTDDGESAEIGKESSVHQTKRAMEEGADIIFQAALSDEDWQGRADFLMKVDKPSNLGDHSYEVIDTKLARETKAGTLLQLGVYSDLLAKIQGAAPEKMHVVAPNSGFTREEYRIDDFAAYRRFLEGDIEAFLDQPQDTYPEMVAHCDYCVWWDHCEKRRRGDDHLCYVAGITRGQIKALEALGVDTLTSLAQLDPVPRPKQGTVEALIKVRDQARVQLIGRREDKPYYELKEPFDAEHGLALLPAPTPDDIFLDFEGNHFAEGGVQEYLTGYVVSDKEGRNRYTALWAFNLKEEQAAYEQLIDYATATRRRNPAAHIYHFAPYEPAALKRLMGRFATRADELDELLRGRAFVDLHAVVRRALIASVERYSIKDLEPFFGYGRSQDLREASASRRVVEHAIDAGDDGGHIEKHRQNVEAYNREDCESTRRLRDWLEHLRDDLGQSGHPLPRPEPGTGEASDEVSDLDRQLQALRDALLSGLPGDAAERSEDEQGRFLLAHMMEFHRREDKATWWEYFRVLELDESDYADDRRAVTGLQFQEVLKPTAAPLHRYTFVPQELDARSRDELKTASGEQFGKVDAVNFAERTIDIKKRKKTANAHPRSLLLFNRVPADELRNSLMRFGQHVCDHGFAEATPYRAAIQLLLRKQLPYLNENDSLKDDDETALEAAVKLSLRLDGQVLAIQGPPGTGKSYTGAHIICALVKQGLKVGVTAVSHKVIVNLMEGAMEQAREQGLRIQAVHGKTGKSEGDWGIERKYPYKDIYNELTHGQIDLLGATAWCWSKEQFEQSVDVLIVDEAGQMSLSNVLSVAPSCNSLILLGDPQQLEQPLQSSHPEGSDVSALHHLLGDHRAMPADRGLFLPITYRLHPDIAKFTSEVFYEGKLKSAYGLENQVLSSRESPPLRFQGSGLRYFPVIHAGNQSRSLEEVAAIQQICEELLSNGTYSDKDKNVRHIEDDDLLIVAPYNAQVFSLTEALPHLARQIGTVDRFQGQQAPVVIYSMTSSSPEDAPRGMEFLYNRNRFNVATSRAKAMCIMVGSPRLFEPECKTPVQMKMANAFCRYRELCS